MPNDFISAESFVKYAKKRRKDENKMGLKLSQIKSNDFDNICNDFERNCNYKLNWIFQRIEKNGCQRRVPGITVQEVEKMIKRGHSLNNSNFEYGEKKLNGTNYKIIFEVVGGNYKKLNVYVVYIPSDVIFLIRFYKHEGGYYHHYNDMWAC